MFAAIYILYLLLCLPITVRACVGINEVQSSVRASVSMLMLDADFDGVIERRRGVLSLSLSPRYTKNRRPKGSMPKLRIQTLQATRPFVRAVLDTAQWQTLQLRLRLGLEEAWSTAVAAGSVRALVLALLAGLRHVPPCDIHVDADFRAPCLVMTAHCVFSVRAGDVMLAVLRTAARKAKRQRRQEIRIPSKARQAPAHAAES